MPKPVSIPGSDSRFDAGKLELSVSDDGRGFDPEAALGAGRLRGESLGLLGMRERVSLVSGDLSIISVPGGGRRDQGLPFP